NSKPFYYLYFDESQFWRKKSLSHLETIIIGSTVDRCYSRTMIGFHTMIEYLLPYVPKLKTLSIKSLGFEEYDCYQQSKVPSITTTTNSVLPLKLEN
ncbi:unnamed protein product, partial [Rotaria sordida]